MTNQEIFDKVLFGLRKQGCQSYDSKNDLCMYRHKGNKCAVGQLIPDAMYRSDLEGIPIANNLDKQSEYHNDQLDRWCNPAIMVEILTELDISSDQYPLLRDLQYAHDYMWERFEAEMLMVAAKGD